MVQKADDRRRLLEFCLEFGNQRHGLGVEVVQVKDHQSGPFGFGQIGEAGHRLLVALDKLHLDAQLARGLLDLGLEEQIVDEAEDASARIFANRNRRRCLIDVRIVAAVAVAGDLDGGGRTIGHIAIYDAVAVVHGTDKRSRALLLVFALALRRRRDAVAGLRVRRLIPSGRISSSSVPGPGVCRGLASFRLRGLALGRAVRCCGCAVGPAAPAATGRAPVAGFVLAAAPAAPMPLRLSLAIGRGWPQFRLGLRRFCRHACTSWHFADCFVALLDLSVSCRAAGPSSPAAIQRGTGNTAAAVVLDRLRSMETDSHVWGLSTQPAMHPRIPGSAAGTGSHATAPIRLKDRYDAAALFLGDALPMGDFAAS